MNLNLLEKLNEKQREATSQIDGSILILAGQDLATPARRYTLI